MHQDLQKFIVCPNLLVIRENKILLLKRADWAPLHPDCWHGPTGKMEDGESPKQTIIREAFEEVGLIINPELGTVVAVKGKNYKNPELIYRDVSLFYVVKDPQEEPINKEPRLHPEMNWFDLDKLPEPIIPVVKFAIEQYQCGELYGEFGY